MPSEPHIIIELSPDVEALSAICDDIGELRDLVPEWNDIECDEICDRITKRMNGLINATKRNSGVIETGWQYE